MRQSPTLSIWDSHLLFLYETVTYCFYMRQSPTVSIWDRHLLFLYETVIYCFFGSTLCSLWGTNWVFINGVEYFSLHRWLCHGWGSHSPASHLVSKCENCGGQRGTGTGFSPVSIIPPILQTPSSSKPTYFSYHQNKRAKPGNLPKNNYLSEIGEHWIGNYFHFLVFAVG